MLCLFGNLAQIEPFTGCLWKILHQSSPLSTLTTARRPRIELFESQGMLEGAFPFRITQTIWILKTRVFPAQIVRRPVKEEAVLPDFSSTMSPT